MSLCGASAGAGGCGPSRAGCTPGTAPCWRHRWCAATQRSRNCCASTWTGPLGRPPDPRHARPAEADFRRWSARALGLAEAALDWPTLPADATEEELLRLLLGCPEGGLALAAHDAARALLGATPLRRRQLPVLLARGRD